FPGAPTAGRSGPATTAPSRYFIAGVAEDNGPNTPRPTLPATSRTMPPIERRRQRLRFGGLAAALAPWLSDAPLPDNNGSFRLIGPPRAIRAGVPIPKFARPCSTLVCELRIRGTAANATFQTPGQTATTGGRRAKCGFAGIFAQVHLRARCSGGDNPR